MAGSVEFWKGMDKASNVLGADKMMIGKEATGEAQYLDFEQANQYLSIIGIEMAPVPAGALPAGPAGLSRTMQILSAGTWTFGGNSFVNPEGSIMKLWWDGTTWSIGGTALLPTIPVEDDVTEQNTNAVSGKGVYNTINKFATYSPNLINYLDFQSGIWSRSSNPPHLVVKVNSQNWISVVLTQGFITEETYYLQGIQSTISGSTPLILFSDSSNVFISQILKSEFTGSFVVPENTHYIYIIIANQSTPPIGAPENVHNNAFTKTVMLSQGNSAKPFQDFGTYQILSDVVVDQYPSMFVQLFPYTAPYAGVKISHEVAHIYEKINKNVYARHLLLYEKLDYADYVSGDFFGGEVVRYAGCKLFSYDVETGLFTDMAKTMIIIPESEFVMNSGAWIGGYHGYENLSLVNFIINNKTYNVSGNLNFTATGLISCNSFTYSMVSVMKLSDLSNYADRIKISDFINGGYTVRSRFKMLKTNTFMAYMGIVCVSKYFTQVTSDTSKIVVPSASNLFPIDNDTMSRELMYSSSDYMVTVSNMVSESLLDNKCLVRLWDRASDTKYYRQIPTYTPAINEFFQTITSVKIRAI